MCNAVSAVVHRPFGEAPLKIEIHEYSDMHEVIAVGIKDSDNIERVVKVEARPKDNKWDVLKSYTLTVDEPRKPAWYTDEIDAEVLAYIKNWVKSRTITGKHEKHAPGRYFVHGKCSVKCAEYCRFFVGPGAALTLGDIKENVTFYDVHGAVTTGHVFGTVTLGNVYDTGSVKTGNVYGTGSVNTGKKG